MDQTPGGLPPRRGLIPTAQPFYPQLFAPPPPPLMPFYDQQYQQGVMMPLMNSDGAGAHVPVWHPTPSFYPYYQQGFGVPLHAPIHQQNQSFTHSNEHINEYPHGGREQYSSVGRLETQQDFVQYPNSRYLNKPQNTPEFPNVEPIDHNQPQENSPSSSLENYSTKSTQVTRHRGSTFPGTSPPAFKHFEGSKKQDWNSYSSQSDSQRGNRRKSGSSDSNISLPKVIRSGSGHNVPSGADREQSYNNFASQDARKLPWTSQPNNSQAAYQDRVRANKELHPQARRDRKPIPPAFRKPHFAGPSLIPPASTLYWVEIKDRNNGESVQTDQSGIFGQRSTFDNSNQIPLPNPTVHVEKAYSPPLVVTSVPAVKNLEDSSNFTLNPKASDFVMVSKSVFPKADGEEDEYVGYYMVGDQNKPPCSTENDVVISGGNHPMDWQLPIEGTVRKIPKELIGKVPGNMDWENGTFNVIRDDRSVRSWGSWNSEDEAEVQARIAATESSSSLKECNEKLESISRKSSPSAKAGNSDEQVEPIIGNNSTESAHTQGPENNDEGLPKSIEFPKNMLLEGNKGIGVNEPVVEALKNIVIKSSTNTCISTMFEESNNSVSHSTTSHTPECDTEGLDSEEGPTQFQVVRGKKFKSKGKKQKKTGPTTPSKEKLVLGAEEVSHMNEKAMPALSLKTIQPAQLQAMATDSSTALEKSEDPKISAPLPARKNPEIPGVTVNNKDTTRPIFNYRDALLKKIESPQVSVTLPNPQAQKVEGATTLDPETQNIRNKTLLHSQVKETEKDTSSKPITPTARIQKGDQTVKSGPSTAIGLRRKFFLQPIPSTVTYHSLIQHIKGGMIEDIYISGLSPHPSAWKGIRSESGNRGGGESRYGHVSFYSNEGANNFWELVRTGNQHHDSYKSPYGGFDDEAPGYFIFDGVKVFVRWRYNDQRLVNPTTLRAVEDENATRCILLRFSARAAAQWIKERKTVPGKLVKNEIVFTGPDLIKKVNTEIEAWGMADSNLETIEFIDGENLPEPKEMTGNYTEKQKPKEAKVVVSFIKILSAVKLKKFLLGKPEYSKGGYCTVEYYKDCCAEPIDELKAIRMAGVNPTTTKSRRRKAARAAKEGIKENDVVKETAEKKDSKDKDVAKENITPSNQSGGAIAKEDKKTTRRKSAEGGNRKAVGENKQVKEGQAKLKKTVVIGKLL